METRSPEEIEQSTERLLRDLKAVVQDGEELLKVGARSLNERGMVARERLAAALDVARQTQKRLEDRAIAGARATDRRVREYPYQALGLAFGIGVSLGYSSTATRCPATIIDPASATWCADWLKPAWVCSRTALNSLPSSGRKRGCGLPSC